MATLLGLYGIPGFLFIRALWPNRGRIGTFALSIASGLILVNVPTVFIIGIAGLFTRVVLSVSALVLTAAIESAFLAALLWRRGRLKAFSFSRPSTATWALGVLTLVSTVFYLAYFDQDVMGEDSCIVRAASAISFDFKAIGATLEGRSGSDASPYIKSGLGLDRDPSGTNPFLLFNDGQRLGPGMLAAPFLVLFGAFGLRLLYALQGLLLPGLGMALGRSTFGDNRSAWLVSLALVFSPYALETRMFNENPMSLVFGTLALIMLLDERPRAFASGIAMSLFFGIRHICVVVLPGVLIYVKRRFEHPMRATALLLTGLFLFLLPYLVLHFSFFLANGGMFEGALDRPVNDYSFLGWHFRSGALLNFPFVPEPLRSPYNAFPNLIQIPLDIVRRFGLAACALVIPGVQWFFSRRRNALWLLAWWFVPVLLVLMVQSNWVEPNKMGVLGSVLAPLVLAMVAGFNFLTDRRIAWSRRLVPFGLGFVLIAAFSLGVVHWRAPKDERVFPSRPDYLSDLMPKGTIMYFHEAPSYVDFDRKRYETRVLPRMSVQGMRWPIWRRRFEYLGYALANPGVKSFETSLVTSVLHKGMMGSGQYIGPLSITRLGLEGRGPHSSRPASKRTLEPASTGSRAARSVLLSLNSPLSLAAEPIRAADSLVQGTINPVAGHPIRIRGFSRPWADAPVTVFIGRARSGTVLIATSPPGVPTPKGMDPSLDSGFIDLDASTFENLLIPLTLKQGDVIRLIDLGSAAPARAYSRYAVIDPDGIWFSDSEPISL